MKTLVLGTRGSALALAQAELTLQGLRRSWPDGDFRIEVIQTIGDKRLDLSLTEAAGTLDKGLFTKELEDALLAGRIDAAVHSLKDLPTLLPAGLKLGAVLERADPSDVLVSKVPGGFAGLPHGAVIATSSLRRQMQLQWKRPDLRVVDVRGNVATRLRKLAGQPEWSATVLAAAGLERLGLDWRKGAIESEGAPFLTTSLTPQVTLPAVGQGAIGLEMREGDERVATVLQAINHAPTWQAVTLERELLRLLGGGCQMPLGVQTESTGSGISLRAVLFREGLAFEAESGDLRQMVARLLG